MNFTLDMQTSRPHETPEQDWDTKTHATYLEEWKRQGPRAVHRISVEIILQECDFPTTDGVSQVPGGHMDN